MILDVIPAGQEKTKTAQKKGFEIRRKFARAMGMDVDANGNVIVLDAKEGDAAEN